MPWSAAYVTVLNRLFSKRALTFEQIFSTGQDLFGYGNSTAGMYVNADVARKLMAVWACQRLLTNSIATIPVKVLTKVGDKRLVAADPVWLEYPTGNPNDTIIDHFADVTMSLLGDGNSFTRALSSVRQPSTLMVPPPDKVRIKNEDTGVLYDIRGVGALTALEVVHISLLRKPGEVRGLSPIDNALDTIGVGLAAQEFGARFFSNGATLSGVIKHPGNPTKEAIDNLRDAFAQKHQGVRNSHAFGVLTGGADFKEISVAPAQAQLIELRKFQIEDIARMYGVPPHMIASQEPGAVAYASVEQRAIDYVQYGVQPLVAKIEAAYKRLLPAGQYIKFNLAALLRGDVKSRYESYQIALQNKFMTIDEVRAFEDMDAFGGKEGGLLETPNNNAPDQEQPADE